MSKPAAQRVPSGEAQPGPLLRPEVDEVRGGEGEEGGGGGQGKAGKETDCTSSKELEDSKRMGWKRVERTR